MTLSVVIPAHNEEQYLGTCLRSIRRALPPRPIQIIVVDNASADRTAEVARHEGATAVIAEPRKGTNLARQRGLLEARGDLVAFLDADDVLPPGWFAAVEAAFLAHPEIVAASGPTLYFDLPRGKQLCVHWWNDLARVAQWVTGAQVMGGNCVVRRKEFLRVGGFDTSRTFYGDDVSTARRLREAGKVLFLRELTLGMSGRRLARYGILRIGYEYAMAYLSEKILRRPWQEHHTDVR